MKLTIKKASIEYFKLPFKRPLEISGSRLFFREGYILRLHGSNGRIGLGELAPLPGVDHFALSEHHRQLLKLVAYLSNSESEMETEIDEKSFDFRRDHFNLLELGNQHVSSCVKFCLEGALLGLIDKLADQASFECSRLLISDKDIQSPDKPSDRTIKIKIGRNPVSREIDFINKIIDRKGPDSRIRLDGNKKLRVPQLREILSRIKNLQKIEYLEEPLSDLKDWEEIYDTFSVPLALDESLADVLNKTLEVPKGTSFFVIRPTLYGGISDAIRIIDSANAQDISCVISSSFNSSVGIASLGYLANFQNSFTRTAAGLGTSHYFKEGQNG